MQLLTMTPSYFHDSVVVSSIGSEVLPAGALPTPRTAVRNAQNGVKR